jgi:transposase
MSGKRYADEFKIEAVKQVTDRGHRAADVAQRLGISQHSLYQWIKQFGVPECERAEARGQQEEIRRLKSELRRVTEERDILKKAAAYFAKESR